MYSNMELIKLKVLGINDSLNRLIFIGVEGCYLSGIKPAYKTKFENQLIKP